MIGHLHLHLTILCAQVKHAVDLPWTGNLFLSHKRKLENTYGCLTDDILMEVVNNLARCYPDLPVVQQDGSKSIALRSPICDPLTWTEFHEKHWFGPHHLYASQHWALVWHPPACEHVYQLDAAFDRMAQRTPTIIAMTLCPETHASITVVQVRRSQSTIAGVCNLCGVPQVYMAKQNDGTACGYLAGALQHFIMQCLVLNPRFGQDVKETARSRPRGRRHCRRHRCRQHQLLIHAQTHTLSESWLSGTSPASIHSRACACRRTRFNSWTEVRTPFPHFETLVWTRHVAFWCTQDTNSSNMSSGPPTLAYWSTMPSTHTRYTLRYALLLRAKLRCAAMLGDALRPTLFCTALWCAVLSCAVPGCAMLCRYVFWCALAGGGGGGGGGGPRTYTWSSQAGVMELRCAHTFNPENGLQDVSQITLAEGGSAHFIVRARADAQVIEVSMGG
jgi:hypothetical protein